MDQMLSSIILILIGVILITALAPTIHTQTDTSGALENVGTSAQSIYNLYDLFWAISGMVLIAGGMYGFFKGLRGGGKK